MAKLIESLALAGSRLADGSTNASGKAWAYVIGTTAGANVFADADGATVLTQPVVLDAAGRATIYTDQAITLRLETSTGASLQEIDVEDAAGPVVVRNLAFTGTLATGSQGAGGATNLDKILTSALTSFGGTDFDYLESSGAIGRPMGAWMREVHVSARDWGATGDNTHDDTTAIQNAVNRVVALGGGTVFLPPGTYLHTAAITNTSAVPVTIRGAGSKTTLKGTSVVNSCLTFSGSGGFQIRDLYIDHSSASTASAINLTNTFDVLVDNVQVHNYKIGAQTLTSTSQDMTFRRCRFATTGAVSGARALKFGTAVTERLVVSDCYLSGENGGAAVEFSAGSYTEILFSGCNVGGNLTMTGVNTGGQGGQMSVVGNSFPFVSPAFVFSGTMPTFRQWSNGVEGVTAIFAANGTATPDWTKGPNYRANATGVGITVSLANPIPTPSTSMRGFTIQLRLFNNNAGVTTWSLDTQYRLSATINTAPGNITELTVEWDVDRSLWNEIARALHN